MNWLEYTVLTTTGASDMISNLLIEAGSKGTMIEDKNDVALNQRPEGQWDIIDEEIARRIGDDVKVTGYYPIDERLGDAIAHIESGLKRIREMGLDFDVGKLTGSTHSIDEEDWAESWKKAYKPFRLGRHMVVKPGWEHFQPEEGDHIIEIDPGMTVIDIGTGTGILAIAAAHMAAKDVLATDLDAMAVKVATENVAKNGFADTIRTRCGDLLEAVDETADVVVANIIADVIRMLAAPVRAHILPGGRFICSGIARERKDEVVQALMDAGYQHLDIREKGEWAAIEAERDPRA